MLDALGATVWSGEVRRSRSTTKFKSKHQLNLLSPMLRRRVGCLGVWVEQQERHRQTQMGIAGSMLPSRFFRRDRGQGVAEREPEGHAAVVLEHVRAATAS